MNNFLDLADLQREQVVELLSLADGTRVTLAADANRNNLPVVSKSLTRLLYLAGVGYSGVKIMPVTVLGADGTGQDSDIISGVVYAADHGADVILMSFSNPGFSESLQDAIDYAWDQGAVLVAATGNDSSSAPTFPAGDRGVIGVASTDSADLLSSTSNYGAVAFMAAASGFRSGESDA